MAATDHPSASPLSIPIDVLLEILAEPVLESSDLARLCLVHRDIIPSARRKLYATVNCDYVLDPFCKTQEPQCWSTTQTTKLLRTLRESEGLSNLVQSIRFQHLFSHATSLFEPAQRGGLGCLVKTWMTLATKLSSVEMINGCPVTDPRTVMRQVLASANCPTAIVFTRCDLARVCSPVQVRQPHDVSLNSDLQSQSNDEQVRIDSNLGRLKYIKCGELSVADPGRGERRTSLTSLEELEIRGIDNDQPLSHFKPTNLPHLQSLQIPFFHFKFGTNRGVFPNLRRLSLTTPSSCADYRDNRFCEPEFDHLSNFPSLEFVSFGIYTLRASTNSGLSRFLRNLPPHLNQLEFPSRAPFDILLDTATSVGRLEIGFPELLDYEKGKKLRIEQLREALQANGGSVYFIGKR